MLLDIPAEMQQFVRDGAELNAYARAFFCFLELLNKVRMLHESKAMSNALCIEHYCVIEVGVVRV